MAKIIDVDTSGFDKMVDKLMKDIDEISDKGLQEMGDQLLALAVAEVPHNEGILQASGVSELKEPGVVEVGFHTKYAARLHEHPEYKFQKGRKGKYLEDPLKMNLVKWLQVYAASVKPHFQ